MNVALTFFFYLLQRTLFGVIGLFAVIWLLVVSVDLVEAMREVSKVPSAGLSEAVRMTLFRTPQLILTLTPFVFLFGTLWAFGQMAKSSEVAVLRSAGLSVWKLVAPPVALAIAAATFTVVALDPLAAGLAGRAQAIKNEMRGKEANMIAPFRDGIWLRESDGAFTSIIFAERFVPEREVLENVTVWRRTIDGLFIERFDAKEADVTPENFILRDVDRTTPDQSQRRKSAREIVPIAIDLRALREDRAKAETLSVWSLPAFTNVMSSAGISTVDYELRFHSLLSLPVKLAAMVLIACAFSLGMNARAGGTARLMGIGIGAGFALFILAEVSSAVARAGIVPVGIASWAPGILAVLFALSLLLYREDG